MPQPHVHDLAVVGAGLCGLAHAWWAARAGRDVVLLEASARVGGVIRTETLGSYRVERAATSVPANAQHLRRLLSTLPAAPRMVAALPAAKRQHLLTRRGLEVVPRSPPALLSSRLLSGGAKLRALAEVLRGPRAGSRSESLFAFVARRFGSDVAERFLVPFTSGVYGAHPARLGAADAFPTLPALERGRGSVLRGLLSRAGGGPREVLLAEGGMERIPEALAGALGARVRRNSPVRALEPAAGRTAPLGLLLASGERVLAREIVLATPAAAQAALLAPLTPHVAETLLGVRSTPLAVVSLGLPPGDPPLPESFGFLAGHRSGARILGATFPSRLSDAVAPPGHGLATVYVGGSERADALALPDADLLRLVLDDLARALGEALHPDFIDIVRLPAAIPLFSPGHRGRMADAQARLARWRIQLSGSHVTGVGLDACCRERGPLQPAPAP